MKKTPHYRALPRRLRRPTLLLVGDRDRTPGMVEGCRRIVDAMPHAELKVYEGLPHSLATEVPDVLAPDVIEFLDRPDERLP